MRHEIIANGIKAVLWQKRGECRIYISEIGRREVGVGSFELKNGRWFASDPRTKDVARAAFGDASAMLTALGFVNGRSPEMFSAGNRSYERLDPDAEPGEPGHIAG